MRKFILLSKALEVVIVYAKTKLEAYSIARELGYDI